jgi:hypothetical protein
MLHVHYNTPTSFIADKLLTNIMEEMERVVC